MSMAFDEQIVLNDCIEKAFIKTGINFRAQYMLKARYVNDETYQEIGEKFGVSGERAKQIIMWSLMKLQRSSLLMEFRV